MASSVPEVAMPLSLVPSDDEDEGDAGGNQDDAILYKPVNSDHSSPPVEHTLKQLDRSAQLALLSVWLLSLLVAVVVSRIVLPGREAVGEAGYALSPPSSFHFNNSNCVYYSARADECAVPPVCVACVTDMTVVLTACGMSVREDAVVAVKSWLLQRRDGLRLHFWLVLSDDGASMAEQVEWFEHVFGLWPADFTNETHFDVSFANVGSLPASLRQYLKAFKMCSTVRLFLTHLLPDSVDAVVYTDVDTVAVSDVRRLWAEFQLHSPTQLLSAAWEANGPSSDHTWYSVMVNEGFPWPRPWGINAGVLLLNLTKMRALRTSGLNGTSDWDGLVVDTFQRWGGSFALGDQDLLNAVMGQENNTRLWMVLPSTYNWRTGSEPIPSGLARGVTLVHGSDGSFHKGDINGHTNPYSGLYLWNFAYWAWPSKPNTTNTYDNTVLQPRKLPARKLGWGANATGLTSV